MLEEGLINDRTSTDNDDVMAGDTVHAGDVEITRVIEWLGSINRGRTVPRHTIDKLD